MTRQFNQTFFCSNCRCWQTQETSFGRWIRNNPSLESSKGYCVTDQDYWVHKFKSFGGRDFQLLMLVEIKTMNSEMTDAQRDTLYIVNQLMRNRRQTPTKELKHQAGDGVPSVYSIMAGKEVVLRAYGMHVITFSGLGPDDSSEIRWDKKIIDEDILTQLLAFEIDPDSLNRLDLRNHHIVNDADKQFFLFETANLNPQPRPKQGQQPARPAPPRGIVSGQRRSK